MAEIAWLPRIFVTLKDGPQIGKGPGSFKLCEIETRAKETRAKETRGAEEEGMDEEGQSRK
jgi:hypothetical protein